MGDNRKHHLGGLFPRRDPAFDDAMTQKRNAGGAAPFAATTQRNWATS